MRSRAAYIAAMRGSVSFPAVPVDVLSVDVHGLCDGRYGFEGAWFATEAGTTYFVGTAVQQ